ncbi:LysM peptidoglycan-binding domain-containing protein [Niallia sp.]|uniref:C40 family peptidase n=1 Tax=Niallia sp. TaxID=2837523 RepID=UPI00289A7FA3|nr:LysM peptidoglycan-binding domain-containing protein [Niallia sp.]
MSLASLTFGVGNTEAASYTIQKNDSLWSIAQKYGTTVNELRRTNNLTGTIIYPNQVLEVTSNSTVIAASTTVTSTSYTIKAGDTLSSIARKFNVSVDNLMSWNNLNSSLIYAGDTIKVNGSSNQNFVANSSTSTANIQPTPLVGYDVNKVVSVAKSLIGTPYAWGGTTPSGFDCSGFVYYVLKQAGMDINRLTAEGYYNRSYNVDKPATGDLIFFENTYKSGISDVGIYLGNNEFISASSNGVSIKNLSNSYWKSHFNSIKRLK